MRTFRSRFSALVAVAFLSSLLLGLTGCGGKNINTANTGGTLTGVVDRHDKYVQADPNVDQAEALADSAVLRQAWQAESVPANAIEAPLNRVADRHDGYVQSDGTLPPYKQRANLRDTAILRELLKVGRATPATNP